MQYIVKLRAALLLILPTLGMSLPGAYAQPRAQEQMYAVYPPLHEPVLYSYCPGPITACADPAQLSHPVQFGETVNEVKVALTRDGRPRLLVRRSGSWQRTRALVGPDNVTTSGE